MEAIIYPPVTKIVECRSGNKTPVRDAAAAKELTTIGGRVTTEVLA